MKLKLIARRYSEAFVSFARDNIGIEKAVKETKALKTILQRSPELGQILTSPEITVKEKFEFLDTTLKNYFSEEIILFLKLLIEKQRISLLIDMLDYIRVNYAHGEAVEAILKSAYPLDLGVIREIKRKLEARYDKKIHFYFELDPDILGGVQVTLGNTVIDGSLRKRIDDLREKINLARMS